MKSCHMIILASITKLNLTRSFPTNKILPSFWSSSSSSTVRNTRRCCRTKSNVVGCQTKDDTSSKVCIVAPYDNTEYEQISNDLAKKFHIPFVPAEAIFDPTADTTSLYRTTAPYENIIHIVPYQFSNIDTYAVAIQPVNNNDHKTSKSTRRNNSKRQKGSKMQPFCIDFCPSPNSKMGKRIEKQGRQKGGEILLKAVALHKMMENGKEPVVYDLNAGFGQDSILLAMGGASKVYMIERDPIVGLLLTDALRRLELVSNLEYDDMDDQYNGVISRARDLYTRLSLHLGDSVEFAKEIREQLLSSESDDTNKNHNVTRPDVCYLDPMFPPRTKSSAVKKNMQILHGLFQHDDDFDAEEKRQSDERRLLEEALLLAKRRVVVKRPINALPLGVVEKDAPPQVKMPSYELKGSINRFDVYVIS